MKGEFNRIYWAMINSETIADGEYYVIHADHIHDFKMAIENYLENDNKKIKKLTEIQNGDFLELPDTHDIMNKINEIIDKINKMEEE